MTTYAPRFRILTRDEMIARDMPPDRRSRPRGLIYLSGAERRRTLAALLAAQDAREAELRKEV